MATVVNTRDVLLLAAAPRLLWTGVRGVKVAADAAAFAVTNAGVATPTTINLTATLNGVNGTINWSVPFGTATLGSSTGSSNTLAYSNMTSKVITVRATVVDGGVTYTDNFTISKVVDGSTGTSGVDAKLIVISTPSQVFSRADSYSTFAPATITLSTSVTGGTASSYQWQYWTGSIWTNISGATSATYTVASGDFTDARTYRISAVVGGVTVTDDMTMVKLTGGTNALVGFLTNESIAFATDAAGTTPANIATLTAGTFKVYWGTTDVTTGCTFAKADTSCTTSIGAATGIYSASAVTADNAFSDFTATHTATGLTITKRLSLSRSRTGTTGAAGTDAKLMSISATSQVFAISKSNTVSPSSITLTANRSNITGATFSVVSGTATLTGVAGDNATLTYGNMGTDEVRIQVTDATSTYTDYISIHKIREGVDAINGWLTNESVTLPASTSGVVSSYAGASGSFIVYYGGVDVTSSCTFAVQSNPDSLTPSLSIVTSGASAGQYSITGGLNPVDSSSVTYRASYTNAFGTTFTIDKVFSLTKSKTGTTGSTGSTGSGARIAYVKVATVSAPLASTPATSTVSGDSLPATGTWSETNAWQTTPPTITAGEQVWQTTGLYNPTLNQTVWVVPYLSNLKVGTLSALTVNTGTLTVDASGFIKGGQTAYNTGSGFWLGYDSSVYKFSIGTSNNRLTYDGTNLQITPYGGSIIFGATSADNLTTYTRSSAMTLPAVYLRDTSNSGTEMFYVSNTASFTGTYMAGFSAAAGNALYVSAPAASFALKVLTGKFGLASATPIDLNGSAGTSGQVLTSAGSSSTPSWGRYLAGGSGTADGSGLYSVTGLSLPDATTGISAISTTGNYAVINSITSSGGTITAIQFKIESRSTGAGVGGAAIRWTAIG